jgi:Na+-translocating ferredoxin:NAD+ oxidoreductase RnfD subunit
VLDAKAAFTGAPDESDQSKRARYEKEQEEIKLEAEHKQSAAKSYFHKHEVFARGVTMFQIAIAIAAISALTKKRRFWIVSLVFGAVGCVFLVLAVMTR